MEGYKKQHENQCVTIFSVPNSAYRYQNTAAILEIDENMNENFLTFEFAPKKLRKGIQFADKFSNKLKIVPFHEFDIDNWDI